MICKDIFIGILTNYVPNYVENRGSPTQLQKGEDKTKRDSERNYNIRKDAVYLSIDKNCTYKHDH